MDGQELVNALRRAKRAGGIASCTVMVCDKNQKLHHITGVQFVAEQGKIVVFTEERTNGRTQSRST